MMTGRSANAQSAVIFSVQNAVDSIRCGSGRQKGCLVGIWADYGIAGIREGLTPKASLLDVISIFGGVNPVKRGRGNWLWKDPIQLVCKWGLLQFGNANLHPGGPLRMARASVMQKAIGMMEDGQSTKHRWWVYFLEVTAGKKRKYAYLY